MWYTSPQQENECNEWMRHEIDRYREEEQQRMDEDRRAREQREQERKEAYEERLRTASTWYEALQKQVTLMRREASLLDDGDTYFYSGADACQRAMDIWREEEGELAGQIKELEGQIAALKDGVKVRVGQRLAAESDNDGWQEVARELQEEDDPEQWLNW